MRRVAIIGAGNIGQAIGRCLISGGTDVLFWDLKPEKVSYQLTLKEILSGRELVFLCVPSWAVREAAKNIAESTADRPVVVSLAKGLERESGLTMDRVLVEELQTTVAVLGGPMLAEELAQGKYSAGVIGCANQEEAKSVVDLFSKTNLFIESSSDVRGVALCGVLKNIFALGIGLADGLNMGINAKGIMLKQAALEIELAVSALGGERNTARGIAGLADLIATSFCATSRNFQVGRSAIALGQFRHSEGVASLPQMSRLIGAKSEKLPLFSAIKDIVLEQANPLTRLNQFFSGN